MATEKQKRALDILAENGGNVSKAMEEAGYSPATAKTPQKLTTSKGWLELLDKSIPDKKLLKVLDEGLEAGKTIFKNNNSTGEIEEVGFEADYAVRHKYLETGLKLKSKMPKENNTIVPIQINFGQDREEFK